MEPTANRPPGPKKKSELGKNQGNPAGKVFNLDDLPDNRNTRLETRNCFSKFTFHFINKVISTGAKYPYQEKMLYKPDKRFLYGGNKRFEKYIMRKVNKKGFFTLWDYMNCESEYLITGICSTVSSFIVQLAYPIFLRQLVDWLIEEDTTQFDGFRILFSLVAVLVVKTYLEQFGLINQQRGTVLRANALTVRGDSKIQIFFLLEFFPNFLDFFSLLYFFHFLIDF